MSFINDPRIANAIDKFNLLEFLDEFGVDYSLEGRNIGNDFIGIYHCVGCGKPDYHFAIHKEKKFGSCWVCKTHVSTIRLIMIYGHMRYKDAVAYLLESVEESDDVVDIVRGIFSKKHKRENELNIGTDKIPASRTITLFDLKNNKYIKEFFANRKLNLWDVSRYDLRIGLEGNSKDKIIFPIYLDNKIVTYQYRSITQKIYHNAENMGNYILYENRIMVGKPLILVEGFLDYTRTDSFIRCYYKDKYSVSSGCLKGISGVQIQRIINSKPSKIITVFDYDSWFDYERIQREIPIDVQYQMLPKNKDPNDLSWKELKQLFKEIDKNEG
jgi:hypothetical protein